MTREEKKQRLQAILNGDLEGSITECIAKEQENIERLEQVYNAAKNLDSETLAEIGGAGFCAQLRRLADFIQMLLTEAEGRETVKVSAHLMLAITRLHLAILQEHKKAIARFREELKANCVDPENPTDKELELLLDKTDAVLGEED